MYDDVKQQLKSMRNKILLNILLLISACTPHAQNSTAFNYQPHFSAVIVHNIDSSTLWYQSVFDLKFRNRINDTARGFRVVIMESSTFLLELIENKSFLQQKKIVADKPEGTRIERFFKIGFNVPDMDSCLKHLAGLKIIPERIYKDSDTKKRNFLIEDPDGNLVQFFE